MDKIDDRQRLLRQMDVAILGNKLRELEDVQQELALLLVQRPAAEADALLTVQQRASILQDQISRMEKQVRVYEELAGQIADVEALRRQVVGNWERIQKSLSGAQEFQELVEALQRQIETVEPTKKAQG